MTSSFISDYGERRRQVRHYVAVVATADRLIAQGKIASSQEKRLITLRSGVFLVLYNLVESSFRNALESIHDQIMREHVTFDRLNPTLRKEVIKLFKAESKSKLDEIPQIFPSALVAAALSQELRIGGNVDARVIRDYGLIYGFSTSTPDERTWGGIDLLTIKSNRNDLAHGRKSYEEVGRQYSLRDLMNISRRTVTYVSCILTNVDGYISQQGYLDSPAT